MLPGGFGTLDELFEALCLVQTRKVTSFPVVLIGTSFWGGLVDWIRARLVEEGMVALADTQLFSVTDDPAEAVRIVQEADHARRAATEEAAARAKAAADRAAARGQRRRAGARSRRLDVDAPGVLSPAAPRSLQPAPHPCGPAVTASVAIMSTTSRVARTSWARTIRTPAAAHHAVAASVPNSR